jgi:branched-chain amino acid transport system substrate-binding protein
MGVLAKSLLLVALAVAAVSLHGQPAPAAEPIRIGAFVSASGPGSFLGDPEAKTLKIEVERVNREGGLLGRQLELTLYDTGSDPKQAVSFARKLIDNDKADVLIGGSLTGETMAVVPLAQDAEIPFISLGGAAVIIEPVKKWVFKTPHTDRMAAQKDFIDMQKRGISKIGIIAGSVGFDESCRKEAKNQAPKYGIAVVDDQTYAQTDTDMTPQLTNLRSHADLQAVLDCGSQAPTAITTRNYQQLGMSSKIPLYFSHAVASQEYIDGAGPAANGVRIPAAAVLIAEQLPDTDPQKKIGLEYRKAYEAAYHQPISTFGGHAYDALLLYVSAVKQAGSTDKAKVRDAIENLKNVVGTDGVFNLSPTDHMGLDTSAFHMVEIENGKWKLLY